jgi:heat-inducible transcriptional repressor
VLDQISRIFNENFSHTSIKDFVGRYIDALHGMRMEFRTAVKALLEKFFEQVGAGQNETNGMLLESGQAVFQQPEFSNFERARELLTAFEYKEGIAKVVSQLRDFGSAPAVTIGTETRTRILKDLSVVVTTYTSGGLERGTIGIIGPRRMNYPKVIASVDYISKLLTRTLMKVPV